MDGMLFVLHTRYRWRDSTVELSCASGYMACRRIREWQEAGVWETLHRSVLEDLSEKEILKWSRASIDAMSGRATKVAS